MSSLCHLSLSRTRSAPANSSSRSCLSSEVAVPVTLLVVSALVGMDCAVVVATRFEASLTFSIICFFLVVAETSGDGRG